MLSGVGEAEGVAFTGSPRARGGVVRGAGIWRADRRATVTATPARTASTATMATARHRRRLARLEGCRRGDPPARSEFMSAQSAHGPPSCASRVLKGLSAGTAARGFDPIAPVRKTAIFLLTPLHTGVFLRVRFAPPGEGDRRAVPEPLDLGPAFRALRKDRGLTEVELARQVGITQTSVWRYEASKRLPPAELLEKMADALGVSKRVKRQLLEQLHGARTDVESARVIGQRGLGRRQGEIARMEAKATQIRNFQASVVPGLLQTPGYARTLFEELDEVGLGARREEVARALAVRLDRQTILHD